MRSMSHAFPASIFLVQVERISFLIENVMRKNEFKFAGPQNLSLLVMFNRFGDVSINPLGVGFQPRRESFTLEVFCLKHLNDVVEKLARVSLKTPTIDT